MVKTLSKELPNLKSLIKGTSKLQQDKIAALQSQLPTEVQLSADMSTDDPTLFQNIYIYLMLTFLPQLHPC